MAPRFYALAAAAGTGLWLSACSGPPTAVDAVSEQAIDTPTRQQTRVFLARLSINPESACAAGVSGEQVAVLFQTAADTLDTLAPSFEANDLAITTARTELSSLRSRAASLPDTALESVIREAETALAASLASHSLLWQTAFESAVAPLAQSEKTLLTTIRSNAQQGVPTEYKAVTRTSEEWAALQKALLHVQSREACNLAPAPAKAAMITAAASDPVVHAARQRLETNLPTVRIAWTPQDQP